MRQKVADTHANKLHAPQSAMPGLSLPLNQWLAFPCAWFDQWMCTLNSNKLKATAGHLHYLSIIWNTLNVHRRAYININTLFGILVPTPDGNTFLPLKYDQKAGADSL